LSPAKSNHHSIDKSKNPTHHKLKNFATEPWCLNMRILIIEDNINRISQFKDWKPDDMHFVFVTSPGTALGLIKRDKGMVYCGVCLDHDLQEQQVCESEESFSGTQIATSLIQNFSYEIPILVHSMNEIKAMAMVQKLTKADFNVTRIAMIHLSEQIFSRWLEEVRDNWACIQSLN
jgi:hypothetical protein